MNTITPNIIFVDHPIKDKDGKSHPGFFGIFQREDTKPTILQEMMLNDYQKRGYIVYFGSIKDCVELLNEYIRD